MVPTAEEILHKHVDVQYCISRNGEEQTYKAMMEFARVFAIEQLKKHVEHPTKPGYKRNDVINHIKELENENN